LPTLIKFLTVNFFIWIMALIVTRSLGAGLV